MVSSRAKTPSGAAEAIPMPTKMDSRAVENERRDGAMVGRAAETASHRERGNRVDVGSYPQHLSLHRTYGSRIRRYIHIGERKL